MLSSPNAEAAVGVEGGPSLPGCILPPQASLRRGHGLGLITEMGQRHVVSASCVGDK